MESLECMCGRMRRAVPRIVCIDSLSIVHFGIRSGALLKVWLGIPLLAVTARLRPYPAAATVLPRLLSSALPVTAITTKGPPTSRRFRITTWCWRHTSVSPPLSPTVPAGPLSNRTERRQAHWRSRCHDHPPKERRNSKSPAPIMGEREGRGGHHRRRAKRSRRQRQSLARHRHEKEGRPSPNAKVRIGSPPPPPTAGTG